MPKANTARDKFNKFLFGQVPVFDQAILKEIRPDPIQPIAVDARLLPNQLRRIWLLRSHRNLNLRKVGKRCGLTSRQAGRLNNLACEIIYERLNKWLKSLPPYRRKKERKKRRGGWEVHVEQGAYKAAENWDATFSRFSHAWPNLST